MPIARRKCSFVNEGSKLPVLAILVASPKSMLGRRSPNCRDDPVWDRAQRKAGTQGTRGNSSAASAIVEWRGGRATYAKFPSILACTQETIIFLAQPVLFHPAGNRLHWGQKKVALFQLPFLLLLKPYTAMTAHTSPQVPIRSRLLFSQHPRNDTHFYISKRAPPTFPCIAPADEQRWAGRMADCKEAPVTAQSFLFTEITNFPHGP